MNRESMRNLIQERSIPVTESGCWIWERGVSSGYGSIRTKDRLYSAHRASYEAFIGPIPDGLCVCHKCDTRLCVNPSHFFVGTKADNNADAAAKGMHKGLVKRPRPVGLVYKRPLSHLDEKIIAMAGSGQSISEISRQLGIGRKTVRKVIR